MLRLEHVSVAYGKHEALHDVARGGSGRTTVILGANGAGKTTLLKTIAGLVRRAAGQHVFFWTRPADRRTSRRTGSSRRASRSCRKAAVCSAT